MALLQKKEVRASFFIIGSQIDKSSWHDSVYQAVKSAPNFKVYNHTYSHAITKGRIDDYYKNPAAVWEDIEKNKKYLPEGIAITRLPGKSTWRIPNKRTRGDEQSDPLLNLMDSAGYSEFVVGWNVAWTFLTGKSRNQMHKLIRDIDAKVARSPAQKRDVIVLSHDYLYRDSMSLQLLGELIDSLRGRKNLRFDWVENLPGLSSGPAH
jgi:peptidoglycan/xylan/chitin deacetylase (PgdA/CDA1 family)